MELFRKADLMKFLLHPNRAFSFLETCSVEHRHMRKDVSVGGCSFTMLKAWNVNVHPSRVCVRTRVCACMCVCVCWRVCVKRGKGLLRESGGCGQESNCFTIILDDEFFFL